MKFGTNLGLTANPDPAVLRDFAHALDDGGFDYVGVGGHALATVGGRFPDRPLATYAGPFYDPFVLFAHLAAVTTRLHFMTSILILPAMPAALVAKQAAELQHISGGRFILGAGISWNPLEYRALGAELKTRGRRFDEQIEVLRRLWAEPYVTFKGRYHHLEDVGLGRTVDPPIPIWIGSTAGDDLLRRIARVADGWLPLGDPTPAIPRLRDLAREAGRDPASISIAGRLLAGPEGPDAWVAAARALAAAGVTHLGLTAPPDLAPDAALACLLEARATIAAALAS